ncbi:MAG: HD domain-containing protein [Chloroflexota bacterium]
MNAPLPALLEELLGRLRASLAPEQELYLVGGAVRDMLLGLPLHDLDFVLPGDALAFSRKVAKALGAAYYPMDVERQTARLILPHPEGGRLFLDFAAQRGPDLESDLRARDFTLNALALALHTPEKLVDPLGGAEDLRRKTLRACTPETFQDDPLRVLRAVRQAIALGFQITPDTRRWLREALPILSRASVERQRDELFRILDGRHPASALRALEMLGVLPYLLPELVDLKGVVQSPPHVAEAWEHTLDTVARLASLLDMLQPEHDPEAAANWSLGLVALRLGRYREQLQAHLAEALNPDRSLRALLLLAALYHDAGKPASRQVEAGGRIRFRQHETISARLVSQRAHALHLSSDEIERLVHIVRHHMRPLLLAQTGEPPSRRAIYRFFRAAGPAGVDVCLLALADTLATYGASLPQAQDTWTQLLDVVRALLEAWWENQPERVAPPPLLKGSELIQIFALKPGPQIGHILEAIREAQAVGEVQDRQEALALTRRWLEDRATTKQV